jgi:hypothetical protein
VAVGQPDDASSEAQRRSLAGTPTSLCRGRRGARHLWKYLFHFWVPLRYFRVSFRQSPSSHRAVFLAGGPSGPGTPVPAPAAELDALDYQAVADDVVVNAEGTGNLAD